MKKVRFNGFWIITVAMLLLMSCRSPQKLYKDGNYDEAVELAVERMRKTAVKEKDIVTMVEAFNYINQHEAAKLTRLRAERNNENWIEIYDVARRIRKRQELVRPLLLLDEEKYFGRLENLKFTEGVDYAIAEARDGAAAYLYDRGVSKLNVSKSTGNRRIAREAHTDLESTRRYFDNYKDARLLAEEAYAFGINHVFVKVENDSRTFLPAQFEQTLESVFVRDLNSKWVKYHTSRHENLRYDYTITARITGIDISPESVRNDHRIEEARVQDGWDYIKDEKGAIVKDSLGNDMKTARFIRVRADIFEMRQVKEARIAGFIDYVDNRTGERLMSRPIESNAVFSNVAVRFEGDHRALSRETERCIGGRPVPFPSNEDMLLRVAENMKGIAKNVIRDNDDIVMR